jgi:hypothetical protein
MEYLRLFEPSMLDGEQDPKEYPTIEDFAPHIFEELEDDKILQ